MPTAVETVREVYDAWQRGDFDAACGPLADDCLHVIHVPRTINPVGGATHGKAATTARLAGIVQDYEVLAMEPGPLLGNESEVATQVHMRYRHRASGEMYDATTAHFWRVENGRITRFEEYHDLPTIEAFSRRAGYM